MHYSLISEIPITETPQPQFLFISTVYHTFIQYQSPLATQTTLFPPLGRPRSERFKFPALDKRKGAPMCFVKNFHVGQFSGPTRGLSNRTLLPLGSHPAQNGLNSPLSINAKEPPCVLSKTFA